MAIGFINPAAYIHFQSFAFQINKHGKHNQRQFNVLCGDNRPQITDGYAKWNVIDRPLRQGISIPTGYNPAQMKLEVRFGVWDSRFDHHGWDISANAAAEVELNIDDLMWMAGSKAVGGPSPVVYVDSFDIKNGQLHNTKLIPRPYWGVGWVVNGGVDWGKSLSHKNGDRIYQEASLTLMGYSPAQGAGGAPKQQSRLGGGFFKTNPTERTALAIASSPSGRAPQALIESLARQILKDPRNNPCRGSRIKLERRSITWEIPQGIDVWVPSHSI